MTSMRGLPELAEADAGPAVRELFQDIRMTLGVTIINLVYRHLALEPMLLAEVWAAIKPRAASGALFEDAAVIHGHLQRSVAAAAVGALPPEALRIVGISPADQRAIVSLIRAYNRANLLNLTGLSLIADLVSARSANLEPPDLGGTLPEGSQQALPALPGWDQIGDSTAAIIHRLNLFGEAEPPSIVASLYRHLGLWPQALALLYAMLAPLQASGRLAELREESCAVAVGLDRQAASVVLPPATLEILRELTGRTIARMVPIGLIAEGLFGAQAS